MLDHFVIVTKAIQIPIWLESTHFECSAIEQQLNTHIRSFGWGR